MSPVTCRWLSTVTSTATYILLPTSVQGLFAHPVSPSADRTNCSMQSNPQLYVTSCGSRTLHPSYGGTTSILCDNYGFPLPVGRFVVFLQPAQPTAQTRGAAVAGRDKRWLSGTVRTPYFVRKIGKSVKHEHKQVLPNKNTW